MPDIRTLQFRNLTVKNRILRSNISGRFDNYDGFGNLPRINWKVNFASVAVRSAVGACLTETLQLLLVELSREEARVGRH